MSSPIPIYSVGNKVLIIDRYAVVNIFINRTIDKRPITASIIIEVYIVDNLKANLLIRNDIIKP